MAHKIHHHLFTGAVIVNISLNFILIGISLSQDSHSQPVVQWTPRSASVIFRGSRTSELPFRIAQLFAFSLCWPSLFTVDHEKIHSRTAPTLAWIKVLVSSCQQSMYCSLADKTKEQFQVRMHWEAVQITHVIKSPPSGIDLLNICVTKCKSTHKALGRETCRLTQRKVLVWLNDEVS